MDGEKPISRSLSQEDTTTGAEEYGTRRLTDDPPYGTASRGQDQHASSYGVSAPQDVTAEGAENEAWSDWSSSEIVNAQKMEPNAGRDSLDSISADPKPRFAEDERSTTTTKFRHSLDRDPSVTVAFESEKKPFDTEIQSLTKRVNQHHETKRRSSDFEIEQGDGPGYFPSWSQKTEITHDDDQGDSLYDLSLHAGHSLRDGSSSDSHSVQSYDGPSEADISLPASVVSSQVSSLERIIESRLPLPAGYSLEHLLIMQQRQSRKPVQDDDRQLNDPEDPLQIVPPPVPGSESQESIEPLRKRTSSWKNYLVPAAFKPRRRRTRTSSPPPRRAFIPKPTFEELEAYRFSVRELASRFKTFENVALRDTRHARGCRVVYYDLLSGKEDMMPIRREIFEHQRLHPSYPFFRNELRRVSDDCLQRIILVEDLSPHLINMLGATFQIPPHVFEQHLDRSGYSKKIEARDNKVAWHARSSAQGYSSITWYRPVLPLIPLTTRTREKLLGGQRPKVQCPVEGCEDDSTYVGTTSNIWRNHLDLCPDPGVYHKQSKTEYPVGWEERATTWTHDFDGCRFAIVLLDPLPVVAFGREEPERSVSNSQPYAASHDRRYGKERPIFRDRNYQNVSEWIGSSAHEFSTATAIVPSPHPPSPPPHPLPRPPASNNEQTNETVEPTSPRFRPQSLRADEPAHEQAGPDPSTITVQPGPSDQQYTNALQGSRPFLMLEEPPQGKEHTVSKTPQDANPSTLKPREQVAGLDTESVTEAVDSRLLIGGTGEFRRSDERPPPRPHSFDSFKRPNVRFVDPPQSRSPVRIGEMPFYHIREEVPSYQTRVDVLHIGVKARYEELHEPLVSFEAMRARASTTVWGQDTFDSRRVHAYIRSQRTPRSTLEEFEYFLELPRRRGNIGYDPLQALFRAMHDDTNSLVEIIRTSLQTIRKGTLDEDLMQKRVKFWRGLMHELNFSLGVLEAELREFEQFAKDAGVLRRGSRCPNLANDTRQALSGCLSLIDRSSQSLLAEMQIADSRRGIVETESVSKLTELAFVFIPLSFCASLFSMQIHELDGGVPVYTFILVAIGFVVMAYAVRLSIRSSRLIEYKIETMNRIREESYLRHDEAVPTHIVVAWIGNAARASVSQSLTSFVAVLTPGFVVLVVLAAIVSPIVLLWQRQIDAGFSAAITMLVLLFDAVLIFPIAGDLKDAGSIIFDPRNRFRRIRSYFEENRRRREKAKRDRKRKANGDLEALAEESTVGSMNGSHRQPPRR